MVRGGPLYFWAPQGPGGGPEKGDPFMGLPGSHQGLGAPLPHDRALPKPKPKPFQLQMLHMVERAETGGVSLFVDGFRVAELLKKEKPDVYKLLTTVSLEYIEEGYDVHTPAYKQDADEQVKFDYDMTARHKIITYACYLFASVRNYAYDDGSCAIAQTVASV
jgi:hypothetical protein